MGHLADYVRKLAGVGATDLLLSSGHPPLYRTLDGLLPLPGEGPLVEDALRAELQELLTPDEWQQLDDEQRVSFDAELASGRRIHGACHNAAHGLTVKLSVLGAQSEDWHELELPKTLLPLLEAETGLIIVTGPSGTGKTTLLARLVSQIAATRQVYVCSSEDPVEYRLESGSSVLAQRALGRHCPSHARAIDTALATEAQVIACSSLDAAGVLELMVEAACSGAVALGELRGQGVVPVLEQLLWSLPSAAREQLRWDIADSLLAVASLDLLPKKSGGRVLAAEVLLGSHNARALIREGKLSALPALLDRESGMQSMDRCLLDLATRGVVEGREAFARATDKRLLAAWG